MAFQSDGVTNGTGINLVIASEMRVKCYAGRPSTSACGRQRTSLWPGGSRRPPPPYSAGSEAVGCRMAVSAKLAPASPPCSAAGAACAPGLCRDRRAGGHGGGDGQDLSRSLCRHPRAFGACLRGGSRHALGIPRHAARRRSRPATGRRGAPAIVFHGDRDTTPTRATARRSSHRRRRRRGSGHARTWAGRRAGADGGGALGGGRGRTCLIRGQPRQLLHRSAQARCQRRDAALLLNHPRA